MNLLFRANRVNGVAIFRSPIQYTTGQLALFRRKRLAGVAVFNTQYVSTPTYVPVKYTDSLEFRLLPDFVCSQGNDNVINLKFGLNMQFVLSNNSKYTGDLNFKLKTDMGLGAKAEMSSELDFPVELKAKFKGRISGWEDEQGPDNPHDWTPEPPPKLY